MMCDVRCSMFAVSVNLLFIFNSGRFIFHSCCCWGKPRKAEKPFTWQTNIVCCHQIHSLRVHICVYCIWFDSIAQHIFNIGFYVLYVNIEWHQSQSIRSILELYIMHILNIVCFAVSQHYQYRRWNTSMINYVFFLHQWLRMRMTDVCNWTFCLPEMPWIFFFWVFYLFFLLSIFCI